MEVISVGGMAGSNNAGCLSGEDILATDFVSDFHFVHEGGDEIIGVAFNGDKFGFRCL